MKREPTVGQKGALMTSPSEAKLEILANPEAMSRRVADWVLELSTVKEGVFAVASLAGVIRVAVNV